MSRTYFKPYHEYKCFFLCHDTNIEGKVFPKFSVVLIDKDISSFGETVELYICVNFPKTYKGNNPLLSVYSYNESDGHWSVEYFRNTVSKLLWAGFLRFGGRCPKMEGYTEKEIVYFMKTETLRKKSGGQKIGFIGELKYKQVTESAYWENLFNPKSGKASVVASNIR